MFDLLSGIVKMGPTTKQKKSQLSVGNVPITDRSLSLLGKSQNRLTIFSSRLIFGNKGWGGFDSLTVVVVAGSAIAPNRDLMQFSSYPS